VVNSNKKFRSSRSRHFTFFEKRQQNVETRLNLSTQTFTCKYTFFITPKPYYNFLNTESKSGMKSLRYTTNSHRFHESNYNYSEVPANAILLPTNMYERINVLRINSVSLFITSKREAKLLMRYLHETYTVKHQRSGCVYQSVCPSLWVLLI
jgi:hypothetical protein